MDSFRESENYFTKYPVEHWTSQAGRRSPIMFRNKQYTSATAALEDYISEFEGRPFSFRDKYEREWWELFAMPPVVGLPARKPAPGNMSSEVKEALNATADLLRYLSDDDLPSAELVPSGGMRRIHSVSTVGTDALLSANPHGVSRESLLTLGTDHLLSADPYARTLRKSDNKIQKSKVGDLDFSKKGNRRAEKINASSSHSKDDYVTRVWDAMETRDTSHFAQTRQQDKPQVKYKSSLVHTRSKINDGLGRSIDSLVDSGLYQQDDGHAVGSTDHLSRTANTGPLSVSSAPSSIHEPADGSRYPPSWVRQMEGSEGSSIVTGHVQGHPVISHSEVKKMASTPKHVASKSSASIKKLLQFEGPVGSRKPIDSPHHTYHSAKLPEKTGTHANSISDTTDSLMFHSAYPFPQSSHHKSGVVDSHMNKTPIDTYRPKHPSTHSPHHGASSAKHKQYLQDLMADIESSSSVAPSADPHLLTAGASASGNVQPTTMGLEQLLQKYKSVQKILSPESEAESASRIFTADSDVTSAACLPRSSEGDFLGRIQRLLNEPVSFPTQSLDVSHCSHPTDSILDGDRSWEEQTAIKPPVAVDEFGSKQSNMGDITSLSLDGADRTLSGGSHPGGLEALKQILFTMQSLTNATASGVGHQDMDMMEGRLNEQPEEAGVVISLENERIPVDHTTPPASPKPQSQQVDTSALLSPQTKQLLADTKTPGGDSMQRALEHLAKLKQLTVSTEVSPHF